MDSHKKELIDAYKRRPLVGGVYIIRNTENGRYLLGAVTNPQSDQSRFAFSQKMDSCVSMKLQKDWRAYGGGAFTFEILETIERKDTQTEAEFRADIALLGELWAEKFDPAASY